VTDFNPATALLFPLLSNVIATIPVRVPVASDCLIQAPTVAGSHRNRLKKVVNFYG
jgi:hypothetical protein